MQILKANTQKSITVSFILSSTKSVGFVYHDTPVYISDETFIVDSSEYTLDDLLECIQEQTKVSTTQYYDYLVVYTNRTEGELQDFIGKLDGLHKRHIVSCKEVLVACRP